MLHRLCRAAGFSPDIAVTTDDYVAAQALVAAGLGIAILPGLALRAVRHPGITATELPGIRRQILAVTYGGPADRPAATAHARRALESSRPAPSRHRRPGPERIASASHCLTPPATRPARATRRGPPATGPGLQPSARGGLAARHRAGPGRDASRHTRARAQRPGCPGLIPAGPWTSRLHRRLRLGGPGRAEAEPRSPASQRAIQPGNRRSGLAQADDAADPPG